MTKEIQAQRFSLLDSGFIFNDAPFKTAHASALMPIGNNRVLCVWFGGEFEGHSEVSIWMAEHTFEGWSKPKAIAEGFDAEGKKLPCWNPVLYQLPNGKLLLFYKVGNNPRVWRGFVKHSEDTGRTWSIAKSLPSGFIGPVRSKPVMVGDWLLCPSSKEDSISNSWTSHLEWYQPKTGEWKHQALDNGLFQTIQPTALLYGKDSIQLMFRSKEDVIPVAWSVDQGKNWTQLKAGTLPNPNSGIDGVRLTSGPSLLVYNPASSGKEWWENRSVLKMAASTNGFEWKDVFTFEEQAQGEFSYPAIQECSDGSIWISYTYKRERIKYWHLKLEN